MASIEAAHRSQGELTRLRKDLNSNWQHRAAVNGFRTKMAKELLVVAALFSELKSTNVTLRKKKLKTFHLTNAVVETGLAEDLIKAPVEFIRKMEEFTELKVKVFKIKTALATLRDISDVTDKELQQFQLQLASDNKNFVLFASLEEDHDSNCLRVTARIGELRNLLSE